MQTNSLGGAAVKGFQPPSKVKGGDEVGEMLNELIVRFVVMSLALRGLNFGNVGVEEVDQIGLEVNLRRGFAFDLRQP